MYSINKIISRSLWSCLAVLALSFSSNLCAQDPVFSQFYNAPTQTNVAFVGNTNAPFIATNYRLQWPGISTVYNTFMISYDQYVPRFKSGFGLAILSDDAGDGTIKTNKISGLYSYKLKVRANTYLKMGLELAVVQSRLDPSKLVFFDQLGATPGGTLLPTSENLADIGSNVYADLGAGLMIYNESWYAGIGLKHLNNPDNTYIQTAEAQNVGIPMRYTVHAGYKYDLVPSRRGVAALSIYPNAIWVQQAAVRQLNIGALLDGGPYFFGLWYRDTKQNGDAIIGNIGVRTGIYKISYSYDATISGLGLGSGGSHEIGVVVNFDRNRPKESRYNDCFSLFR